MGALTVSASARDQLSSAYRSSGKSFEDFLAVGADGLSNFWQQIPSHDVDCELTLYRDRQWTRPVQGNDVWDIGHLVLAIPSCSAVVVEKFWARGITETGLAEKYALTVFTDLRELLEWLNGQ